MNKLLMILITTLISIPALAFQDDVENDKELHFGVSFGIAAMTYGILDSKGKSKLCSTLGALSLTMAVGVAKEVYDSRQPDNYFDWQDVKYDALGALSGVTVMWSF